VWGGDYPEPLSIGGFMPNSTNNSPAFVKTPAGSRIPKMGTLAYHPNIGFAEVVGRVGDRVRIRVNDFSEATDVALRSGTITRKAWMQRLADASENSALAEIDALDARSADPLDALYEARPLVKQMQESIISRTRRANEMLINLDAAGSIDWEFDEYMTYTPKSKTKRGKAPAPRPYKAPASNVGTLEDPTKPDWLVAEMNECFGDMWTPANPA
tara:strand:- start:112 stop:753 length:642 start_codon:yes stop_codon:yes gene_type:complete